MKHSKRSLTHFVWTDALLKRSVVGKKILLNAEHQTLHLWLCAAPTAGLDALQDKTCYQAKDFLKVSCTLLILRRDLMHRWLLFSKSAELLVLPLRLESSQSTRIEPGPTLRRRFIQQPIMNDGGRGETIFFVRNDLPKAGPP